MGARQTVVALALLGLAACGGGEDRGDEARAVTPLDHATTGTITGDVLFQGEPPTMAVLPLGGEPVCSSQHTGPVRADDALVHDGHLENAFVYVKDGLGSRVFAVPTTPVEIDQRGCIYHPHVAGAQVRQPITFINSDALLHNVHGTPAETPGWNFGMGVQGSRRTIKVDHPEVMVGLRCDVHPWMKAYLGVVDHPYFAVTGADGRFTLPDVPPGEYTVAAWHERFGVREVHVTLGARETKALTFTFVAGP